VLKKLFVILVIIFVSFFVLISVTKDIFSFVQSQTLRIETVNINVVPITETVVGSAVFAAEKIVSPCDGNITFVQSPGTYVDKGTVLARIAGKDFSTDIVSPAKGIFLWDVLSAYEGSLDKALDINNLILYELKQGQNVKTSDVIGSIAGNNDFALRLNVKLEESAKSIPIILNGSLITVVGSVIKNSGDEAILKLNSFFDELYNKKKFDIVIKKIRGFEVDKRDIVKANGVEGIYVVNGDRLKFLAVDVYKVSDKIYVSVKDTNFSSFTTFLMAKSPLLLKEGDLVGSF
jgi:hypothetical protein